MEEIKKRAMESVRYETIRDELAITIDLRDRMVEKAKKDPEWLRAADICENMIITIKGKLQKGLND